MTIDWTEADGTDWREEFKFLKGTLSIKEIKLLEEGAQTMQEAWKLGSLHAEYKKLKKKQPPKLPSLDKQKIEKSF